jgi:hypothetical protein
MRAKLRQTLPLPEESGLLPITRDTPITSVIPNAGWGPVLMALPHVQTIRQGWTPACAGDHEEGGWKNYRQDIPQRVHPQNRIKPFHFLKILPFLRLSLIPKNWRWAQSAAHRSLLLALLYAISLLPP